jgi:hypothetical protein
VDAAAKKKIFVSTFEVLTAVNVLVYPGCDVVGYQRFGGLHPEGKLCPYRIYGGVSKSFRTGRLERELQMVQLSVTRCSYIAIS